MQKIYYQLEFSATSGTVSNYIKLIYNQLTEIRSELNYPSGGFSSLRALLNAMYDKIGSDASPDYSTVLSNIKKNTDSLISTASSISGDTNNISQRSTDILNKLNSVYSRLGTLQTAVTNHIDTASAQNHSDFSSLLSKFATSNSWSSSQSGDALYRVFFWNQDDLVSDVKYVSWDALITHLMASFTSATVTSMGNRTLYSRLKQLQEILASDDDLALKKDNKANEKAATSGFVNGSSSKTSLGAGDFGNLKDIGGTFNDLSSLNGQAKISSFLSGLSSADSAGQGWFSEVTRVSLDSVTPSNSAIALSYVEPIVASASLDDDPYNMGDFVNNYAWLWGGD